MAKKYDSSNSTNIVRVARSEAAAARSEELPNPSWREGLKRAAHADVDGPRLAVAIDEQLVFVANLVKQPTQRGERHIGGSLVVHGFDDVAFLNAGIGGG